MIARMTSRIASAVAIVSALAVLPTQAGVLEQTKKVGGVTVHYKVVLPDGYDAAKAYPGDYRLRRRSADDEHRRRQS